MGLKAAVVTNEAQSPEFIHEKIPGSELCRSSPPTTLGKLRGGPFKVRFSGRSERAAKESAPAPEIRILFPRGLGHAWFRHFFLDAGKCRLARSFQIFFLGHVYRMSRRREPFYSIWNSEGMSQ